MVSVSQKHIFRLFLGLTVLFSPFFTDLKATHIAGAELTYRCLGSSMFEVNLKLYRDCQNAQQGATFDDPLTLFVFYNNGQIYGTFEVYKPPQTPRIDIVNWNACFGTYPDVCVEEGVYSVQLYLPPTPGGYDIGWSRCCRNNIITNLQDPLCQGVSFLAHVPSSGIGANCNSMPVFKQRPSMFLCVGQEYNFDHSAIDLDGDSLVYKLSTPYTGTNFQGLGTGNSSGPPCPASTLTPSVDVNNPMGPPPYDPVSYATGYTYLNPFGNGQISIDPQTGWMRAEPANIGVYVVAISVLEYRNGLLLSENKRDFQFNVISCLPQNDQPTISPDFTGLDYSNDTLYVFAASGFCYDFQVTDQLGVQSLVVDPISVIFGGNGGFPPPYATYSLTGQNPVNGTVCWTPPCEVVGKTYLLFITARDEANCPNYNIAFDSLWITVLDPPVSPPQMGHDLAGNQTNGDTILVEAQENFCYRFYLTDTTPENGVYSYTSAVMNLQGDTLIPQYTITPFQSGDTLYGDFCWQAYCNVGATYLFVVNGYNESHCPPDNLDRDSVWLRVVAPPYFSPEIYSNLGNLPLSGDTILASVHENFCFDFGVIDTSGQALELGIRYQITPVGGGIFQGAPPYVIGTEINDTLAGKLCWTPSCEQRGQTFRLVVWGVLYNTCFVIREVPDTFYVRVDYFASPLPLISHQIDSLIASGDSVTLINDEGFCYNFRLEDPVNPSRLGVFAELLDAAGNALNPDLISVSYGIQSDSLLTGTLCWNGRCNYPALPITIHLIGADSLDCELPLVHDYVYVNQELTVPPSVTPCAVTVVAGDEAINFIWEEPDRLPAFYLIQRRREDEVSFTVIDTVFNAADTLYNDIENISPDEYSYCYRIVGEDICGTISPISGEVCSFVLIGERENYNSLLQWGSPIGWPSGVAGWELFVSPFDGQNYQFVESLGFNDFSYTHEAVTDAVMCYRIRAIEAGLGCGIESWSNEICLAFPPNLYFPNAFTPNGDGLNDSFGPVSRFFNEYSLSIYDRWGKLVFFSNDPNVPWWGTVGKANHQAPEGVYVYVFSGKGYDGNEFATRGSVTLLR